MKQNKAEQSRRNGRKKVVELTKVNKEEAKAKDWPKTWNPRQKPEAKT